jgi:hypothetical protein
MLDVCYGIYSCRTPFEGDMQLYLLGFPAMVEPQKVKNGFLVMIRTTLELRELQKFCMSV